MNAFYMIWTRKEAYCKGIGTGLYSHFEQIDVTTGTGNDNEYMVFSENIEEKDWVVRNISIADNYAAAVAVQGNDYCLSCWEIS